MSSNTILQLSVTLYTNYVRTTNSLSNAHALVPVASRDRALSTPPYRYSAHRPGISAIESPASSDAPPAIDSFVYIAFPNSLHTQRGEQSATTHGTDGGVGTHGKDPATLARKRPFPASTEAA